MINSLSSWSQDSKGILHPLLLNFVIELFSTDYTSTWSLNENIPIVSYTMAVINVLHMVEE